MSWAGVIALSAGAYVLKAAGAFLGDRIDGEKAERWSLEIVVVAVLAALIVVQTVGADRKLVIDARLPAVLLAALLVWLRTPFLLVVVAAGATAALLRVAGMS
jgi:branched-subunit amino acid transport protein